MNRKFTWNLIIAFIIIPLIGFSQREFYNWYFGDSAGVSFNTGVPVVFMTNKMDSYTMGSSNISDSLGNILFYTNSWTVYNRNNDVMPNGWLNDPGCGAGYLKLGLAFQQISDHQKYYLFTTSDCILPVPWLYYSVIDMTLDGGLGDIPSSENCINIPGTGGKVQDAVTGTRTHNNRDVWVVVRYQDLDTNCFFSYLVDAGGIHIPPVLSPSHESPQFNKVNSIKISRDGTKMAVLYLGGPMEFCQFNTFTGHITSSFIFNLPEPDGLAVYPQSFEFSRNARFLYISGFDGLGDTQRDFIFQFDATQQDSVLFMNSAVIITDENRRHAMQLAPDGKIYCSTRKFLASTSFSIDSLNVINNPSSPGLACNYQKEVISLQGRGSGFSLPDFVERYYAVIHDSGECVGNTVHFNPAIWPPPDSIYWNFGDLASGSNNYSTILNPVHTYPPVSGTYTVELYVRHNDNRTDTTWKQLFVLVKPDLGPDRILCNGAWTTFDAGICPGGSFLWKNLGTGITVGTNQTFQTNQPGTYALYITNPDNCIAGDTVLFSNTPIPSVTNNPLSKTICSGESTNILLTSNVPGATFHWTATLTTGNIAGFSADSGLVINQVLVNSLSSPGIITYHITPEVGSCSGTTVDFPVTVNPGDSVKVSISASTNNICAGTAVTYNATPTNGGIPTYQWKVNGLTVGSNSPNYTYSPISGDIVSCILTSSLSVCISNNPATSNTIQMIVNPLNPVSISISPSANPVCGGTSVTFTSATMYGGTTPFYQWKVNGLNVGLNQSTYTYNPVSGGLVSCILTSNILCPSGNPATSNTITMIVNPNLPVSITITPSVNPVCSGIAVTYTCAILNGGPTPVYQWKVNGVNVGTNSPTYMYNPASGDLVSCILTSNIACPFGNPATSNIITMTVATTPIVTFTRCFDSITTTNAQPFKLKGGIPLGGTYSGAGVNSITGIFSPALAGTGAHPVIYTYTNAALCSAHAIVTIVTIVPAVTICGNPVTDIRDNKVYPTVQIGSQCWMAENLNYGIEILSTQHQRDNCIPEKYHNPASGILHPASVYQWDEIMNYDDVISTQGLCPPGWHVPSEADWNTLFTNYINNGFAASPLKYSGFSGFNALLSGTSHMNRSWDYQGFATFFWSSTSHGPMKAESHGMNDPDPSVSAYPSFRNNAFSVRCLKD